MSYTSARAQPSGRTSPPSRSRSALERFSSDLERSFMSPSAARVGQPAPAQTTSYDYYAPTYESTAPAPSAADRGLSSRAESSPVEPTSARSSSRYSRAGVASGTSRVVPTHTSSSYDARAADRSSLVGGGQPDVTADIASLNSSLKTLAAHCQAMEGRYTEERQARLQLEEQVKQLARTADENTGRVVKLTSDIQRQADTFHEAMERHAAEQREVMTQLGSTVEAYNEEVEERLHALAKTLVGATRDGKDRADTLEKDFQMAVSEMSEHMMEQARAVDARFIGAQKSTAEKWDAVERNLIARMEPIDARMAEQKSALMRMLEESNRGHNVSRERQQKSIADLATKLRTTIEQVNAATLDRMDQAISSMEGKMDKTVEDTVDLMTKLKAGLEDKLEKTKRVMGEHMDEGAKQTASAFVKVGRDIDAVKADVVRAIEATAAELRKDDDAWKLELEGLVKQTADELLFDIDTERTSTRALGDALDAKVMEAQAELTTVRQRLEQQIVANATMLGGLIDDSTTKLGTDLSALHHTVDVEVASKLQSLDVDLRSLVEDKVVAAIDDMTSKLHVSEGKISTIETRMMLDKQDAQDLKAGVTKALEDLNKEFDAFETKLDDVSQNCEIDAFLVQASIESRR